MLKLSIEGSGVPYFGAKNKENRWWGLDTIMLYKLSLLVVVEIKLTVPLYDIDC